MTDNKKSPADIPASLQSLASMKSLSNTLTLSENPFKIGNRHAELIKQAQAVAFPGEFFRNTHLVGDLARTVSELTVTRKYPEPDFRTKMALRAIEDIKNSPALKSTEAMKELSALRSDSIFKNWLEIRNSHAFNIISDIQKEHGERVNSLLRSIGQMSEIFPSKLVSDKMLEGMIGKSTLPDWGKLASLSIPALSINQQERVFITVSDIFSKHSAYFSTFTTDAVRSVKTDETEQIAKWMESEPDAGKQFLLLPTWLKWVVLTILTHLFLPTLEAIRDDVALEYLKEKCFTSYFCENKSQQANIITTDKPEELSYSDLNRFRVVTKDHVRLRSSPSMKGEVIETLPLNQPLLIINRENRSWILIRTQINGENIEGWINRAYTRAIIK